MTSFFFENVFYVFSRKSEFWGCFFSPIFAHSGPLALTVYVWAGTGPLAPAVYVWAGTGPLAPTVYVWAGAALLANNAR